MPARYTIDQTAGVVRVECSGVLTNEEMLTCIRQVFSDPARWPGMPALVDWQNVRCLLVTRAHMQAVAEIKTTLVDPEQLPWALAIVAPGDEAFWVARTYEVLRAGSRERVRVFRQRSEAEKWLAALMDC